MKRRYYVYAYKIGDDPRNSCVIDILFDNPGMIQLRPSKNDISIECFPQEDRMYDVYPPLSKWDFESLYGKIDYP